MSWNTTQLAEGKSLADMKRAIPDVTGLDVAHFDTWAAVRFAVAELDF